MGKWLVWPWWPGTIFSIFCAAVMILLASAWAIDRRGCHEWLIHGTSEGQPLSLISSRGYIVFARIAGGDPDVAFVKSVPRNACPILFESRIFGVSPHQDATVFWHAEFLGVSFGRNAYTSAVDTEASGRPCFYLAVPIPIYLLVLIIPPCLIARRRMVWKHRITHGLCLACGYDLQASPEKCPECGKQRRADARLPGGAFVLPQAFVKER